MKSILWFAVTMAYLFSNSSFAQDQVVDGMGVRFVNQLPADWHSQMGDWQYFDVASCFTGPGICYGSNPSSPYGSPLLPDPESGLMSWAIKMKQNEAIVIFLKTPPKVRYYAFTQYLMKSADVISPEFASLGDSLNNMHLKTSNSVGAFNAYSVVVWSPDYNTQGAVLNMLRNLQLEDSEINFIDLPKSIPNPGLPDHSFSFATDASGDYFNMLMRTALPEQQSDFDAYMKQKPFFVVKVGPGNNAILNPIPYTNYKSEATGVSEKVKFPGAQKALDMLVSDIQKKYGGSFNLKNSSVSYTTKVGWDCINQSATCAGDNHDALYSRDSEVIRVSHLDDFIIIAGVNHQKTGKATYFNHSVYDTKKIAGIVGVADPLLTTESALYHADAALGSAKANLYKNLYAYIISYNCQGRQFCLQIPAPTPENPVGLEPGAPFLVVGRSYMDPISSVRPSVDEIIQHKVMIANKKK